MKLTGEQDERLAKRFTESSEAYQLYLKGRHYWTRRTPDNLRKGLVYFQQAIEKDAGYALAYAGLADCYSILSIFSVLPAKEAWAKAKAAAAAVALDPELAEGHTSLAFIRWGVDWDTAGAEAGFRRAMELNPAYWVAPYWYSALLTGLGRFEDAEHQLRRAEQLEPLSPIIGWAASMNSLMARRNAQAIERCLKALEIDPDYPLLRLWLGMAYEQESKYAEALREMERAYELFAGEPVAAGSLAHLRALMGNRDEALRLLDGIVEPVQARPIDGYHAAIVYSALGEKDQALAWLQKTREDHSGWLALLGKGDPRLDGLRSDTRFSQVLRRMNVEA